MNSQSPEGKAAEPTTYTIGRDGLPRPISAATNISPVSDGLWLDRITIVVGGLFSSIASGIAANSDDNSMFRRDYYQDGDRIYVRTDPLLEASIDMENSWGMRQINGFGRWMIGWIVVFVLGWLCNLGVLWALLKVVGTGVTDLPGPLQTLLTIPGGIAACWLVKRYRRMPLA